MANSPKLSLLQTAVWKVQHSELCELQNPIKLNQTVLYTCLDVGENYIWCGTNKGSVYVFHRHSLKHCFLIPLSSTADITQATRVSAYHDESLVAVSTSNSNVYICGTKGEQNKQSPLSVLAFTADSPVTHLVWLTNSTKLLIGTETGKVVQVSVLTSKIFCKNSELASLDAAITQIYPHPKSVSLIISTVKYSYIYLYEKKSCQPIGKKARNGKQGACFLCSADGEITTPVNNDSTPAEDGSGPVRAGPGSADGPAISGYCSRPGLRLWKVNESGSVCFTIDFRQNIPHKTFVDIRSLDEDSIDSDIPNSFLSLLPLRSNLLISQVANQILVINPLRGVIELRLSSKGIIQLVPNRDGSLYTLTTDSKIHHIQIQTIPEYIESSLSFETIEEVVQLCLDYHEELVNQPLLLSRVFELCSSCPLESEFNARFSAIIANLKTKVSALNPVTHVKTTDDAMSTDESPHVESCSASTVVANGFNRQDSNSSLISLGRAEESRGIAKRLRAVTLDLLTPFKNITDRGAQSPIGSLTSHTSAESPSQLIPQDQAITSDTETQTTSPDTAIQASNPEADLTQSISISTLEPPGIVSSGSSASRPSFTRRDSIKSLMEINSPGDVVDTVKGGLSKIAHSFVATIKERARSQTNADKSMMRLGDDVASLSSFDLSNSDKVDGESTEVSDDSASHGFFIGDDALLMETVDERQSELNAFREYTKLMYRDLTAPAVRDPPMRRLMTWNARLAEVVSLYQGGQLAEFTRKPPWHAEQTDTEKYRYLATLSVVSNATGVDAEDTVTTPRRYMMSFYFLMDVCSLLNHLQINMANDEPASGRLWESLIGCFLQEGKENEDMLTLSLLSDPDTSIYQPSLRSWIDSIHKPQQYWLLVYTLGIKGRLDDLLKLTSRWASRVSLQHIWRSMSRAAARDTSVPYPADDNTLTNKTIAPHKIIGMISPDPVAPETNEPDLVDRDPLVHDAAVPDPAGGTVSLGQTSRFIARCLENVLHHIAEERRLSYLKSELSLPALRSEVVKSLLQINSQSQLTNQCICGYPRTLNQQPKTYLGQSVIDYLLQAFPDDPQVSDAFLKLSATRSTLDYLVLNKKWQEVIRFLVLTTDVKILQHYTELSEFTVDLWSQLLHIYMTQTKQRTCLWCNTEWDPEGHSLILLTQLAEVMLIHIGPRSTLSLLDTYISGDFEFTEELRPSKELKLPASFIRKCIRSEKLSRNESGVVSGLVEAIENHVWDLNTQPKSVNPEVAAMLFWEREMRQNSSENGNQRSPELLAQVSSVGRKRVIEHPNVFWGRKLCVSNRLCDRCFSPLQNARTSQKVLFYICDHAIHSSCQPGSVSTAKCPLCHR